MKLRNIIFWALVTLAAVSCKKAETADYDGGYGYVQFRLFKEASYSSKAVQTQLDYLSDACKVKVTMLYEDETISQTMVLQNTTSGNSEFGLRSEKLKLYHGDYTIINFTLYDAVDNELYIGVPPTAEFKVVRSQLVCHDLTVNVMGRGKIHFTFTKDFSGFQNTPDTKSVSRQYTFDEVAYVDVTLSNKATGERVSFEKIETDFTQKFSDEPGKEGTGYRTSILETDKDYEIKAGEWKLLSYDSYTKDKVLLEHNGSPLEAEFKVTDNGLTDAKVPVTLYESDEYIKDYYALYEIWKALDGPNWYYSGESYVTGTNWNFDKDPDLWGDQPGVQVYSNGRVALINLDGYNFAGDLPAAIGQLKELNQLYLGSHNSTNFLPEDPGNPTMSRATLFERHKKQMESLHQPTPMSEPIARALKENGISIPEIALYDSFSEDEIIEKGTGATIPHVHLLDNNHGVLSNRLRSIDPAIGELTNLQYFFIANSTLESLPSTLGGLSSLTDFELYNCPQMKEFPMSICDIPELVSVNISNNAQWSAEEILKGLKGLANGPSAEKIQIFYCSQNNLEELPEEISHFKAMGLFDVMSNKISKVAPFGHDINLVDCYLDNNRITEIGRDAQGFFCGIEDIESFTATYNQMTEFPDIFTAKSKFLMGTVDFSHNRITGVEGQEDGTYRGLKVSTLSMANNPIEEFPTAFAASESIVSYYNFRGCQIANVPEEAFTGEMIINTTTMDLSYNHISSLPEKTFTAVNLPYLYGIDLGYNRFSSFPFGPLDSSFLTVMSIRGQRDAKGNRCLKEWPTGIYQHKGLRGLYIGSNDLRKVSDTISTLCYYLDISDNPNITFDASDICSAWYNGMFYLIYDKSQNIVNCDYMLY